MYVSTIVRRSDNPASNHFDVGAIFRFADDGSYLDAARVVDYNGLALGTHCADIAVDGRFGTVWAAEPFTGRIAKFTASLSPLYVTMTFPRDPELSPSSYLVRDFEVRNDMMVAALVEPIDLTPGSPGGMVSGVAELKVYNVGGRITLNTLDSIAVDNTPGYTTALATATAAGPRYGLDGCGPRRQGGYVWRVGIEDGYSIHRYTVCADNN